MRTNNVLTFKFNNRSMSLHKIEAIERKFST